MIVDPLTWLFAHLVHARNARFDRGRAKIERLRLPVISVGNLSVGGSGKTPFVQTLARWLTHQGVVYDILSRGYGRQSHGVLQVDAEGPASQFGDEPLLLARTLGAPVFVGESRYQAGLAAERWSRQSGHATRLHILDDGFQHRQLHRDYDIVLLATSDLRARLLPFGRLREPLTSLDRAQAIAAPEELAAILAEPNVWRMQRRLEFDDELPSQPLAFCGLARPRQFWHALNEAGIYPVATCALGDHHRYTHQDVTKLRELANRHGADGFITTEKDLVKLDSAELQPIVAPRLLVGIDDEDACFGAMLRELKIF